MKKRMICLLLACLFALSLFSGCGSKMDGAAQQSAAEAPAEQITNEDAANAKLDNTETTGKSDNSETSAQQDAPDNEASPDESAVESQPELSSIAKQYIDSSVEELYSAIGQPDSSSYASSCNGPGEDGELYYEGFTVYTYKEGGKETVVDVW